MRVYVAGPLSSDPAAGLRNALAAATQLLDAGLAPYVPHLTLFWDRRHPRDYEVWMRLDLAWLEVSEALLLLPGESPGAEREVARAKELGLPIFHSVAELLSYLSLAGDG